MTVSGAISGYGTLLKAGATTIAEVTDISGPSIKLDTQDVTTYVSPGAFREKLATLLDAGDVKFTISFLPTDATHNYTAGLLHNMVTKALITYSLVFPNTGATTWTFTAYVAGFDLKTPVDNRIQADITLTITGMPTFT